MHRSSARRQVCMKNGAQGEVLHWNENPVPQVNVGSPDFVVLEVKLFRERAIYGPRVSEWIPVISNPEKLSEIDQLSSLNDVDALAFCGFCGALSG
jgi:hypothetical protein